MRTILSVSVIASMIATGCSTPQSTSIDDVRSSVQALTTAGASVPGFAHTLATTAFSVGATSAQRDEFGMHKVIGDQGVFATRKTGLTTALANADAQVRQAPPFPDAMSHDAKVRDYFVKAGIPTDQIASVANYETVGAPADPKGGIGQGSVVARFTMITRQIQGIPVADSFAWAELNANGEVVEEQAYWPAIPTSVVQSARALASSVANVSTKTSFEALLPPHRDTKGVVIHHSPGEWDGTPVAGAFYDVVASRESFAATLHADATGSIVTLPYEQPDAWGPMPAAPLKRR
jgi:hypothetical protein